MVIEGLHYSPKCFCKNCKEIERRNNISNYMTSLQKESEWESELKELLEKQGVDIMEDGGHQIFDEQVALIIRILSNREKEIAEEVEKKKEKLPYTPRYCQSRNGIYYCGTCEQAWETCSCSARNTGYKRAIDEVLSILKH